jgi:predicted metal-dependent hydrolase
MKLRHKSFFTIALTLCILALGAPARADQPYMVAARKDLNKAQNALERATDDKGGHRKRAIGLVGNAIRAVNDGIEYDKKNPNNRPRKRNDLAAPDQPNMQLARQHLQSALANLERATADKGGYRVKALQLVRDAIQEVNKGIEYDRRN